MRSLKGVADQLFRTRKRGGGPARQWGRHPPTGDPLGGPLSGPGILTLGGSSTGAQEGGHRLLFAEAPTRRLQAGRHHGGNVFRISSRFFSGLGWRIPPPGIFNPSIGGDRVTKVPGPSPHGPPVTWPSDFFFRTSGPYKTDPEYPFTKMRAVRAVQALLLIPADTCRQGSLPARGVQGRGFFRGPGDPPSQSGSRTSGWQVKSIHSIRMH